MRPANRGRLQISNKGMFYIHSKDLELQAPTRLQVVSGRRRHARNLRGHKLRSLGRGSTFLLETRRLVQQPSLLDPQVLRNETLETVKELSPLSLPFLQSTLIKPSVPSLSWKDFDFDCIAGSPSCGSEFCIIHGGAWDLEALLYAFSS
jgi:hypothetical protein